MIASGLPQVSRRETCKCLSEGCGCPGGPARDGDGTVACLVVETGAFLRGRLLAWLTTQPFRRATEPPGRGSRRRAAIGSPAPNDTEDIECAGRHRAWQDHRARRPAGRQRERDRERRGPATGVS